MEKIRIKLNSVFSAMEKLSTESIFQFFFIAASFLACITELYLNGLSLYEWDLLFISGLLALSIGIKLSRSIPDKLKNTLDRLKTREILTITEDKLEAFKKELATKTSAWSMGGGLIISISIVIAFIWAYGLPFPIEKIPLTIFEVIGGYIAGWYIGRMVSYGSLERLLRKKKIEYKVNPGHPDESAGLRPIGDFYFFQAMVTAIPVLFLGVWLLIIPRYPLEGRYEHWEKPYLFLMPLALICEILSFVVPIWFFHIEMKRQKLDLLKEADSESRQIIRIQRALIDTANPTQFKLLNDQLSHMKQFYNDIENMPTWPLDSRIIRYFALNNILLSTPLLDQLDKIIGVFSKK